MELTVLGTCGAYPGPGRAASGYLVRHQGYTVAVDLGTGVLANLQTHIDHHRVDALVLSHEHLDHWLDLYPLFMARYFHPEPLSPLPVIAPGGVFDLAWKIESPEDMEDWDRLFDVRRIEPGDDFELGPFHVKTRDMRHWVQTAGFRFEANGTALAYSADTGPTDELTALAEGVDLLLSEASWLEGQGSAPMHLTAREAGEHASKAGVDRLLLSHFWPTNEREAYREQAAEAFDGDMVLAEEGLVVEVGQ